MLNISLITISLLCPIISIIISRDLDIESQWFLYDQQRFVISICLSILIFRLVPYRDKILKSLSLISIFASFWWAMDYYLLEVYPLKTVRMGLDVTAFIFCFLLVGKILFRRYKQGEIKQSPERFTGFLYKEPKNILGLICSFFHLYPVGSKCVLIDGKHYYKYKNGVLVYMKISSSFDLISRGNFYFREVKLSKGKYDSMIGKKWSLKNNCFKL